MHVASGRQVHANAVRPPYRDGSVGHFEQEAGAVLDRAAVLVRPMVRTVLEELVRQVAVGAVDLDAVEAGDPGVLSGLAIGFDDVGDLAQVQRGA